MDTNQERGGFNIVRWSVDHPYIVISFFLAMLVLGYIAIGYLMPKRFMPYVESPMLGIITEMPGLSAEEMETYFSSPIEQRMVNVSNVRYIRSVSQEGFSMVTLEYPYGTDMQRAQVEVQSLLNVVQADLPGTGANLKPSWILKVDPLNLPVLTLSLRGDPEKGWTLERLRDLADNQIINRFKAAHRNIFTVSPFGGYRRQLQVQVDRDKLASFGISILDVRDAIDMYNVAEPAGLLTGKSEEPVLRMDTIAKSAADIENYVIKASGDRVVRVGDVANVTDTFIERRSAYRHNGQEAIAINVLQNADASSPVTIDAVMKIARQLEEEYPGISFDVAYDNAGFVDILFHNMWEELIIAIVLTGLLVLLFLGDWRGTGIALTAIPTSLAMALLGMAAMGMSLNSSTLIGLLIAIGRLVDDAIIDIHAVERHLRMGKDRRTATIDGISEVRRSVLAATIVLIVALIPLMLSGGITQLMFVGLCWPIIFGLIFSYIVSMTLTAVLCSRFLKLPEHRRDTWFSRNILGRFESGLTRMEHGYERLIRYLLKHPLSNFARIGITIVVGFGFYYFIGSEMMPLADVGQASVQMEMKPGTSFAATEKAVKQFEQIMAEEGADRGWIQHASVEIGAEGGPGMTGGAYFTGYGMNTVNGAAMMLTFSDKDSGRPDIWHIMDRIHDRALEEIPGIRRVQLKEMGSDVMATALAPVALVIYGTNLNVLDKMGKEVLEIARKDVIDPRDDVPDMAQPFLSWEMSKPTLTLKVDQEKAAANGLSPMEIAEQAYYALRGGYTTEFYRLPNRRPMTIQVRYDEKYRENIDNLQGMFITGANGEQVPLLDLVTLEERLAPSMIEHDQLRRVMSVGGYYRKDGRPSMDVTMDLQMKAMSDLNWPPGYGIEARGDMTQMMDSFRVMLQGLLIALVLMYLILVAQFGGFLQPLQMIFSLPLELSGVFFMLWLTHQAFSTVSILGIIVLSGMDIVTAILVIDLILNYRHQGMPRNEAIAKAAPQRLRPILMTSIITIFVMAGVAFWPKTGLDAYQPLGTVIIGGLVVGTILSLLDIPVMHAIVDDISRWLQIKVLKKDPNSLPPIEANNETP
jgi:HAE1 family hydrophobic/amphiphilic exporter-1